MQITTFELIVGLAGLISLSFNLFQLYKDRINRQKYNEQIKFQKATLLGILQNLTEGANSLKTLEHKGSDASTISSNMERVIDSQRIQLIELLENYYEFKINQDKSVQILGAQNKDKKSECIDLIEGVDSITATMIKTVEEAERYIFTVGGRSRNDAYLDALKKRVDRGDIRYIRVITGDHIRHPLCKHIRELKSQAEIGYLEEDKYGGILVTHNNVILALQSSRVPTLDKALQINGETIASDYRMYILELLSSSNKDVSDDFILKLCKTCRKERNTVKESI